MDVIYLHGFLSSPGSAKAQVLRQAAQGWGADFFAPDLNMEPKAVDAFLRRHFLGMGEARLKNTLVVGSSLGGFYALRACREFGCLSCVVNPCLTPWEFIGGMTGWKTIFGTDRKIEVKPSFAEDFIELDRRVKALPEDPSRCLALLSTEDEVLDWRRARSALADSPTVISEGDDHRMRAFQTFLPAIKGFLARRTGWIPPESDRVN